MDYSFTLEVITPLFLSGADQQTAEIRPPSVRGALRFWFRAMMGGVVGGDWRKVKELEDVAFGSTEQASEARLRVKVPGPLNPRPWDFSNRNDPGISYLGYGLSGTRDVPPRKYISSDLRLDLELSLKDRAVARLIIGSVWLLANLGGLGARTRRGFGGLKVIQFPNDFCDIFKVPEDEAEIPNYFRNGLVKIRNVFREFAGDERSLSGEPLFSILAPNYWVLKVLNNTFPSWRDAMNWIGQQLREFREDRAKGLHTKTTRSGSFSYYVTKDYDEIRRFLSSQSPNVLKLPIFGMPLQFRLQSLNKTARVRGEEHERRASPLFIRIFKLTDKKYLICLMKFQAQLLGGGEKLRIEIEEVRRGGEKLRIEEVRRQAQHFILSIPNWKMLDDFLDHFSGQEVRL